MRPSWRPIAFVVTLWLILPMSARTQEAVHGRVVDVGTFTIEAPEGDDWNTTVDKEHGYAEFSRGKQKLLSFFTSGAGGGTIIKVFTDRPMAGAPGIWLMNESQVADYYRDNEVSRMEGAGLRTGYTTSDVRKDTVRIDGTLYYFLSYTNQKGTVAVESILYLCFPPGFAKSRELFGFLVSESFRAGSIFASKDLEQIKPIMKSLSVIDPLQGIGGAEGDLLRASARGDTGKVSELVRQGANVNAAPGGRSALVLAAMMGHEPLVRFLTEHGAALNPGGDNEDAWPLTAAILGKEFGIARYLIERGAPVNLRSNKGWTPLMRAIGVHADTAFLSLLIGHGAGVNDKNDLGWTPLMAAAYENQPGTIRLLFGGGAEANLRSSNGWSAVMIGAQNNAGAAVGALLDGGADPGLASESGWTATLVAAGEGNEEILEMLAAKGADLRARTKADVNALDVAAYGSHPACLSFLLGRGLDVNEADGDGWTPLMYAASKGDTVVARLLIQKGADLNRKNNKDKTALEIADDKDHDAFVEMLKQAGAED